MKNIIHVFPTSSNEKIAITVWLEENNITFEESDSPYNPEIVNKVLDGMKEVEKGNYMTFSPDLLRK